jgi:hypothetical protein
MEAKRKFLLLPIINPSHSHPLPVTLLAKPTQTLALHTLKQKKHARGFFSP